jgi:hypothetical protein
VIIAFSFVLACASDGGELRVVVDSTMASNIVEVLALRAPTEAATSPASGARGAPPVSRAVTALDDSVRRLDSAFQSARDAINRETIALGRIDRRTREYASAYSDLQRRIAAAERLRAARDSLRAARSATEWAHEAKAGSPSMVLTAEQAAEQLRHARETVVRRTIERGEATLELETGTWWIAAADSTGTLIGRPVRHEVRAGERDTVRLGSGIRD